MLSVSVGLSVILSLYLIALITPELQHQSGSYLVDKYFIGHTRLPPNLGNFEGKLKSGDRLSYFQLGIYRELSSLYPFIMYVNQYHIRISSSRIFVPSELKTLLRQAIFSTQNLTWDKNC